MERKIWTIGHSTHSLQRFVEMLHSFEIELVADIRNYPGSRRFPHFNFDSLKISLPEEGMEYVHFKALGGRRKPRPDSKNLGWRVEAFKGYADHMETDEFLMAIKELQKIALTKRVAYMCSEAVWWRCHRSLVSDYFKFHGWTVFHIMDIGKSSEHPYTKPARIKNNELVYPKIP